MKTAVFTLAIMMTASIAALAHQGTLHNGKAFGKGSSLICPVTGTKIASARAAVGHEAYKGRTYYFCCPDCKPHFDNGRDKIIASAAKGKFEKM